MSLRGMLMSGLMITLFVVFGRCAVGLSSVVVMFCCLVMMFF